MTTDDTPGLNKKAFTCPRCRKVAQQFWSPLGTPGVSGIRPIGWMQSSCSYCEGDAIWNEAGRMVEPFQYAGAPLAREAMPDNVRALYNEAALVAGVSPRSAAALLRLTLEVLINDLVPGREDLNDKIKALVTRGLDELVQQTMDFVRVIGNNGVHLGQIDLTSPDEADLLPALFDSINLIVEQVVERPARVQAFYERIPENLREKIKKRDGRAGQ